jgi:hypothetical protein
MIRRFLVHLSGYRSGRSSGYSFGLLSGLLMSAIALSACSGSKLGETVGKTLEPDPQLTGQTDSATPKPAKPAEPDTTNQNNPATEQAAKPPAQRPTPKVVAGDYIDLDKAPEEIQPYLVDLIELNLLTIQASSTTPTNANSTDKAKAPVPANEFRPNQALTRREYARWLLATNNRFYADQRTRKIRPGVTSSTAVFQDVKTSDPDFGAIQGLAEAGIIPSPLTGSSTALTFRPDAPLTRKDLLLWKVPLDTRQPLPQATAAAVEQAWGFQDANKIEPRALQAVLADYQNGDFANIRRAFSYTTLFQPDKAATRAEAAAVLWRFGNPTEGITAAEIRNPSAQADAAKDRSRGAEPNNPAQNNPSPSNPSSGAAPDSLSIGTPQGG